MPNKQKINIVWFTTDLRCEDSLTLNAALSEDLPVLCLYVFDQSLFNAKQFGFYKIERYRAKFLLESVNDLGQKLNQLNLNFLIKFGKIGEVFDELEKQYTIANIFAQKHWTSEELLCYKKAENVLPNSNFSFFEQQLLFGSNQIDGLFKQFPRTFTEFRIQVEKKLAVRNVALLKPIKECHHLSKTIKDDEVTLSLLGFDDFKTHPKSAFPFHGGQTNATSRVNYYLENYAQTYKQTRNGLIGLDYSSKFSPWLANGSLSPVTLYQAIKMHEAVHGANESTYWLFFELLWREFFKHTAIKVRNRIFFLRGLQNKKPIINENSKRIKEWINGNTPNEFVNALMIELAKTGWMSNRGRQIVASYFCKHLQQDWRIGATYFEAMLIDYDPHSNYGNWMYLAGVGNDNRDRVFNPDKQAKTFDSQGHYRSLWLSNSVQGNLFNN